jgi:hypothetical protein
MYRLNRRSPFASNVPTGIPDGDVANEAGELHAVLRAAATMRYLVIAHTPHNSQSEVASPVVIGGERAFYGTRAVLGAEITGMLSWRTRKIRDYFAESRSENRARQGSNQPLEGRLYGQRPLTAAVGLM